MLTIVKKSASYGHTRRFPRASGREGSPCLIFSLPVKFAEGAMIPGTQVPSPAVGRAACRPLTAVHCDTWRRPPPRIPPPPGERHPKHPRVRGEGLSDRQSLPSDRTSRVESGTETQTFWLEKRDTFDFPTMIKHAVYMAGIYS